MRSPRRRLARVAASAVAGVLALLALGGIVAHLATAGPATLVGVSAFSPYLMLGAPVALVVLAAVRSTPGVLTAAVLTAVCLVLQVPPFVGSDAPAGARTLTAMTANLRLGGADASDVVAAVRRDHVDALMLEELTPAEQSRLQAAGLDRTLRHHVSDPRPSAGGTGLWSRYPLIAPARRPGFTFAMVTARVRIPGVMRPVLLAAAHLAGPWPDATDWQHDIRSLRELLPSLGGSGPVVLGGDLNATNDIAQFRELLHDGYADAADQAGAGTTRTYPADRWYPPLIAIDHVLTRHAVGTAARTVSISGSDHRALLADVAIGRSA